MDSKLKHIVHWVNSKGIKVKRTNRQLSFFVHQQPDRIYIGRNGQHGLIASILHEYYHSQQVKRGILLDKTNREYRAELFVIRCHKKLDIIYDKTFITENWGEFCFGHDEYYYYAAAYDLLIENAVI